MTNASVEYLDENRLNELASRLCNENKVADALKIYLYMAQCDPSLDGGTVGMKLAECYELLGDQHSAKYWVLRAVDENPQLWGQSALFMRLSTLSINDIAGI